MNETDKLRLKIIAHTGRTFTCRDFGGIECVDQKLYKLARKGEILFDSWLPTSDTKPVKVYKKGKLHVPVRGEDRQKAFKPKHDSAPKAPENMLSWQKVFPEFFAVPDFTIVGKITRRMYDKGEEEEESRSTSHRKVWPVGGAHHGHERNIGAADNGGA